MSLHGSGSGSRVIAPWDLTLVDRGDSGHNITLLLFSATFYRLKNVVYYSPAGTKIGWNSDTPPPVGILYESQSCINAVSGIPTR